MEKLSGEPLKLYLNLITVHASFQSADFSVCLPPPSLGNAGS
jgi:hypothetical protein